MKSLAGFLCFVAVWTNTAGAAESAYTALRALGKERGQEVLSKVVEVRGVKGNSQPDVWRVVTEDSNARAGVREFEVTGGRVVGERTPSDGFAGSLEGSQMDFGRLNLDSPGAFTIAEKEAASTRIGFDSVDYLLTAGEDHRPVWILILLNDRNRAVGKIHISAEDGRILRREGFVQGEENASGTKGKVAEEAEDFKDHMDNFARKVHRKFMRDTAPLQEFFTGERSKYRDSSNQ